MVSLAILSLENKTPGTSNGWEFGSSYHLQARTLRESVEGTGYLAPHRVFRACTQTTVGWTDMHVPHRMPWDKGQLHVITDRSCVSFAPCLCNKTTGRTPGAEGAAL